MRKASRALKHAWLEARRAATFSLVSAAMEFQPATDEDQQTLIAFQNLLEAMLSDSFVQSAARKREKEQENGY